ncbi:winged helix-turn-helix transcriptional regulator [Solimonas soli]|uniref:winged helix-turn-helix transcriptional regulator n=1 Tax=Solimonas soli TaxID=413479 RepID=UPI0004818B3E|nr:helix-turn-helix domain-containing protein [Solimonas soli]
MKSAPAHQRCAVEAALDAIGGKWKGLILYHLTRSGTLRFNELKRLLPGVTQRMLTKQLRELEAEALVLRTVYAEVPPRVEYRLSAEGLELRPVIEALREWGVRRENSRGAGTAHAHAC